MYKPYRKVLFNIFLAGVLLSLFAAGAAFPVSASFRNELAAPAHNINFRADGLPSGVSFTITGTRYNNGGHLGPYSISYTTPDLSASIGVDDGSEVTYSGFPASLTVGTVYFVLQSVSQPNPFTAGAPGGVTTVVATYQAVCVAPTITADPGDLTVQYGDAVTFTVAASGSPALTYEWYKDNSLIQGADQSTYTIPFAHRSDAGGYYAVVTNSCGTDTSVSAQLTVNKADQLIDFTPLASPAIYGTTFNLQASANSGLEVTYGVSGVCSLAGSTVTMTSGTGACTITASQAGDDNYNPAPDVTQTVNAAKADQLITFTPPVSPAAYGTSYNLEASASSGLEVTFGVSGVCSLAGNTVTMTSGTGGCTITASQGGNENYNPAPTAMQNVDAARAEQFITFVQPLSPVKYQTSFTVAPSSSSGLPVTLISSGSCTNSGFAVTMVKTSGTCLLTASQAGNLNYLPAQGVQHSVDPSPNRNVIYMPIIIRK